MVKCQHMYKLHPHIGLFGICYTLTFLYLLLLQWFWIFLIQFDNLDNISVQPANKHHYSFTILADWKCRDVVEVYLLILVRDATKNIVNRHAICQNWVRESNSRNQEMVHCMIEVSFLMNSHTFLMTEQVILNLSPHIFKLIWLDGWSVVLFKKNLILGNV